MVMSIHHHFPNSSHQNHNHDHDHHRNNSSNPLFCSILTLYVLILLYFPHLFLTVLLSPLFLSTLVLLLLLLRFGASQQVNVLSNDFNRVRTTRPESDPAHVKAEVKDEAHSQRRETPTEPDPEPESEQQGNRPVSEPESERPDSPKHAGRGCSIQPESSPVWDPNPTCRENFVEWDMGAPLEVIYEKYEGEAEGNEDQNDVLKEECTVSLGMYPSLSGYYPESALDMDSESSLGSESASSLSWDGEFHGIRRWEEGEEQREGLIEIDLQHGDVAKGMKKPLDLRQVDEEDNLIEIDISRTELILGIVVDHD